MTMGASQSLLTEQLANKLAGHSQSSAATSRWVTSLIMKDDLGHGTTVMALRYQHASEIGDLELAREAVGRTPP
jgi:hypothetical protein